MADLFELMAAPFAACVVLVGIHAYLGLHVIQRKVIFVDLALAQIAALGATIGFLLGVSPHSPAAYLFSLTFAIIGAGIFALTRMRHERIPQEAIIGIVYGVALATAILVADRAPEGAEHIKETLTGTLLWVRWPTILETAAIYLVVAMIHVGFRKRFFQISFAPEQAYAEGRWVRVWDFIFYVTFALVITYSVAIAGVLVVFSFLVIPAVIATLFAERVGARLALGCSVGLVACALGLVGSYRLDLPSGPSVVAALGLALVLAALIHSIWAAERRGRAAVKVSAGIATVAVILAGLGLVLTGGRLLQVNHEHEWEAGAEGPMGSEGPAADLWARLEASCGSDPACAAELLRAEPDWPAEVERRLREAEPAERESLIEILGAIDAESAPDLLVAVAGGESDALLRLRIAELLIAAGDARGETLARELLGDGVPLLVREEARGLLGE